MSEPPDDLMGKADALLSRYRNTAPSDVPVLTEVVELPGEPIRTAETPAPLPPDWLEPELAAWEQRLRDRLLAVGAEFRARVEDVVEDEVRAFRAEVIERLRSRQP